MKQEKISTITKEQLIENGWIVDDTDPVFPMSKDITKEDYEGDDKIELVLHLMYTVQSFALSFDGYLVNINPESIEDLKFFEKMILSIESPY